MYGQVVLYACMYVCMYVWMHMYIYIYIYICIYVCLYVCRRGCASTSLQESQSCKEVSDTSLRNKEEQLQINKYKLKRHNLCKWAKILSCRPRTATPAHGVSTLGTMSSCSLSYPFTSSHSVSTLPEVSCELC